MKTSATAAKTVNTNATKTSNTLQPNGELTTVLIRLEEAIEDGDTAYALALVDALRQWLPACNNLVTSHTKDNL